MFPMENRYDFENPGEYQSKELTSLILEWGKVKADLEKLYRVRDKQNINVRMKKGIDLFLQYLFCSNEMAVVRKGPFPLDSLRHKPVNVSERLGFILKRPSLYHSYRQLSELFLEQEKLFAKNLIMKKASKP
ncbi:YpoC family protein [Bacillus xiapuensis]|uniref:YpoC-like domain-containing protein n=1 Tax=Bacillus xiapuensis TaxID=2014075 RepID=A0ABU6N7N7_9BACI|nr:hypothetical protein [Bacillus xiapuensis]